MMQEQLYSAFNDFFEMAMANVHTITIGRVTAVNAKTIDVRPVINRVVNGVSVGLPVFTQVPPIFLSGGSSSTSYPIAIGDYALLLFTERCFDRWYSGDDYQKPLEMRMHDYSDGFALVGIKNAAGALTIPTQTTHLGVMRIGVANPTDFAALAGKVLDELNLIKTDLDNVKATFDAHTHQYVPGILPPVASAAPSTVITPPHTPASVASTYVKTT